MGGPCINGLSKHHRVVRKTTYLPVRQIIVDAWLTGLITYVPVLNNEWKMIVYPHLHQCKVANDLSCL